ncbi:hypothetical protein ACFCX0_41015 [Streptomyces sp. NPDC056352]|uniref:hypothetical protein n=1 Tax=Streptomyces sp. NPDC056352 TaxID=3345791 RepID=UPI0035D78ED4
MAAARTALLDPDNVDGVDAAARTVRLRAWRNRLTADNEGIQIRLGPDNRRHPLDPRRPRHRRRMVALRPRHSRPRRRSRRGPHRRHAELTD